MYGDCQVLPSSMAENGVSPDSLFSSPARNHPNFNNFMAATLPFHPYPSSLIPKEVGAMMMRSGKEEMDSLSGSEQIEGLSGNEQDNDDRRQQSSPQQQTATTGPGQQPKKKRYHRHTARQIQEMEALFKECPHPDDKQRMKLSQELGLKPRQVKFWFQNRRTQMKAQHDRQDNVILRAENDTLKNENYRLQAVMRSLICPSCGGQPILGEVVFDEQQLQIENARLKEELDRLCSLASRYSGRSLPSMGPPPFLAPSLDLDMSIYSRHFQEPTGNCIEMMPMPMLPDNVPFHGGGLVMDKEKSLAMELAMSAVDELVKMCQLDEPLWMRSNINGMEILNAEEHMRMFPWPMDLKQHYNELRTEATRSRALVIMNSVNLVDAFLDANKWMELFPSIVTRAKTIQIIASGVSGHASGSFQLMYAELQVLSPLVPTRETLFLRYCQQNPEEGAWVIVDFPMDSFHGSIQLSFTKYRRRPSGCIIQDMPNGYSKVTWVEHAVLVEEKPVHQIFSHYVNSGMAFGAHRWLAILQRQCERVASLMARNISDLGVMQSPEARKNLMRLAQRMIRTFCTNISTSDGQSWTAVSDSAEDTIRITTRKVADPGQPNGLILSAVSTTWLPFPHDQVFQLLKNERRRSQFDALSNGNSLQEVAHIANGSDPGNCISLLRINVGSNSSQNVELMLQESCTDYSGSLIVYTMVEVNYIQLVMSVEDPSCIPLLPIGYSIIPMSSGRTSTAPVDDVHAQIHGTNISNAGAGGCLLTIGHQVHASTVPTAKLNLASVTAITNHIRNAVQQINAVLGSSSNSNPTAPAPAPAPAAPGSVSAELNASVAKQ
ncbi:hypothetical protein Dimus_030535 [Dionaea muscipula]